MTGRLLSGAVAYLGFCALVAAVQYFIVPTFWVNFGIDAAVGAAIGAIFVLAVRAIGGYWIWE